MEDADPLVHVPFIDFFCQFVIPVSEKREPPVDPLLQ